MNYSNSLYLTNKQYYDILLQIKLLINKKTFSIISYDNVEIGYKNTYCNCGIASDNWIILGISFILHDNIENKCLKYNRPEHHCPFDNRKPSYVFCSGCFYTCYIFKCKKKHRKCNIEFMNKRVDFFIKYAEQLDDKKGEINYELC